MSIACLKGAARFCSIKGSVSSIIAPKTKVIVLGGTSHLAGSIVHRALELGYSVIGTSRAVDFKGLKPSGNLDLVHIPADRVTDVATWKKFAESKIFFGDRVLVVNAMGGANCEALETLETKNIDPVVAALEGIQSVAKVRALEKFHFLNLSSLAAEICSESGYGKAKKECDSILLEKGPEDMTILRVSYAVNPPARGGGTNSVSDEHWYSVDQLATLPFQIVLGDKDVPMQPVALSDIADVACNSLFFKGKETVYAVGPQIVSQMYFAKFFANVLGKKFNPLFVDSKVGALLAKHFSKGHFSSYAIEAINKGGIVRDPGPFELRKGSPLLTLEDQYKIKDGEEISIVALPIIAHLRESIKKVFTNPEVARDTFSATRIFLADKFVGLRPGVFSAWVQAAFEALCRIGPSTSVTRDGVSYRVKIVAKDDFNKTARLNANKFAKSITKS